VTGFAQLETVVRSRPTQGDIVTYINREFPVRRRKG
jgi:hypothetical protein